MIKDTPKDGKLREMIFRFWYRRYFDSKYGHSDMVVFVNSVLSVVPFKKPKNYWERIIMSPGSVEAFCDRLIRAADECKNLEDRVVAIIDDVIRGDRLRILPVSVTPKEHLCCSLCNQSEECKLNRKRGRFWLCDFCDERRIFFASIERLPSIMDPGEYIVVKFAGEYRACERCGGLVYY